MVLKEWATLTKGQRKVGTLAWLKRESRAGLLKGLWCLTVGAVMCVRVREGWGNIAGSQRGNHRSERRRREKWSDVPISSPNTVFLIVYLCRPVKLYNEVVDEGLEIVVSLVYSCYFMSSNHQRLDVDASSRSK